MDAVFDLFGFSQCHGDTEHRSKLVLLFQLSLICCLFFEGFKSRMSPLFSRFSHPSKLLPTSCSYISVSLCLCERSTLRSSDEANPPCWMPCSIFSVSHRDTEHRSKLVLLFQSSLICCLFLKASKVECPPCFPPTSCSYISVSPCLCERSTLRSSDEMNHP